jgi:hypothetical protein
MALTELELWDTEWCRWYEMAVRRGKTPNQATQIAYRLTEARRELRPDGTGQSGVRPA